MNLKISMSEQYRIVGWENLKVGHSHKQVVALCPQ